MLSVLFISVSVMTASQNEGVINIAPGPLHEASKVIIDKVILGNEDSEKMHEFVSVNSVVRTGGLGEKCRVIMPREPDTEFVGGSIGFTMMCEPELENYVTVKLWGSEIGETVLYLYHNGMQIRSSRFQRMRSRGRIRDSDDAVR